MNGKEWVRWVCLEQMIKREHVHPEGYVLEECLAGNGPAGILALHGGYIEYGTEQLARYIGERVRARVYLLGGYLIPTDKRKRRQFNFDRLHYDSHTFLRRSKSAFTRWRKGTMFAISIHGHRKEREYPNEGYENTIFIGGLHKQMAKKLQLLGSKELTSYNWTCDSWLLKKVKLGGTEPKNPVNLPPLHGIQLELPKQLRAEAFGRRIRGDALHFAEIIAKFIEDTNKSMTI